MFTKSRIMLVVIVMVLLVLTTQSVLANFTNGPENPGGAIVFRGEDIIFLSTEDYESDLTVIHNGDIVEYCLGNEEPAVFIDFQDIYSPNNENRILQLLHGEEVPTTIWPFAVDWESDFCAMFLAYEPIAVGTARLRLTDNDVYAWTYTDNKYSNAFGWTSQGRLYSPDGEAVRFNSVFRAVWDGIDGEKLFNSTSKINVK